LIDALQYPFNVAVSKVAGAGAGAARHNVQKTQNNKKSKFRML